MCPRIRTIQVDARGKSKFLSQSPYRFAFVEYKDEESAKKALEQMNDADVLGRKILINVNLHSRFLMS